MGAQIDSRDLLDRAWMARKQAYAPYSKFDVGAALLCGNGTIFTGCNVENISFGLTVCAERAALFSAVCAGERDFIAIAIVASTRTAIAPCGACRQVLAEFNPQMAVFSEGADGNHVERDLAVLLPVASAGILERLC